MTSKNVNQKIIDFLNKELARVKYNPNNVSISITVPGFYFDQEDADSAESAPKHIIKLLQGRYKTRDNYSSDNIRHDIEKETWCRSFTLAKAFIVLDLATGKSPKRHIQECQEAIYALEQMGEREAEWYRGFLQQAIAKM
jgi:hypothetical protein